jgi:Resolvase, N terminal domain
MPSANGHGPNKTMERVALYLRVSSEEQKTRETIATQDAFLSEYCNLYHHEIVGAYKDAGISGTVPMAERLAGRSFAGQEVPESSAPPRHDLGPHGNRPHRQA